MLGYFPTCCFLRRYIALQMFSFTVMSFFVGGTSSVKGWVVTIFILMNYTIFVAI